MVRDQKESGASEARTRNNGEIDVNSMFHSTCRYWRIFKQHDRGVHRGRGNRVMARSVVDVLETPHFQCPHMKIAGWVRNERFRIKADGFRGGPDIEVAGEVNRAR